MDDSVDGEQLVGTSEEAVDVEQIIQRHARAMAVFFPEKTFFAPEIPEAKLNNAIQKYAPNVEPSRALALHDDTLFGGAKEGFLVTDSALYFHGQFRGTTVIRFNAIVKIELEQVLDSEKDGEQKFRPVLTVTQETEDVHLDFPKAAEFHAFLNDILAIRETGATREVDGIVIVEDMAPEVKEFYIKAIANMTWDGDQEIDECEMAELQTLMTQVKTSPETRLAVRSYLFSPDLPTEEVLKNMDAHVPSGSEVALHLSLVKDMVRVLRSTKSGETATENAFLRKIASFYGITEEQILFVDEVCQYDEKILLGQLDDDQVMKNAKELAGKGAAIGVPIAAVYMSGSVVGLSAAGVTSGLSALGLGGVLGLSSMVTGIGVAVLIGITAYKGFKWFMAGGQNERAARREFLIQEVVRLQQQTISNLAQDVNFFAQRILVLIKSTNEDHLLIEKLGRELTVLTQAIDVIQAKNERLEGASIEA